MTDAIIEAVDGAEEMPPVASNAELAKLPRNDTGNARRLFARHGSEMAWVPEIGWLVWDGKRWAREKGAEEALQRAQDTVDAIYGEAEAWPEFGEPEPDETNEKAWAAWDKRRKSHYAGKGWHKKFAVSSGNGGKTKSMLEMSTPKLRRSLDDFDSLPWHFNVLNGTLRLDQGVKLYGHRVADRLTRIAAVKYDPDAECPDFREFVATILPDEATMAFTQKAMGYATVTGDISEQCIFLLDGRGSNGKSTFLGAIARTIGDYAAGVPIEAFLHNENRNGSGPTPEMARLPGIRLVRTSEPQPGARLSETRIKQWTGGEPFPARHLNKDFFEFLPAGKLIMSCNVRPKIAGKDEGIKSRVIAIPFKHRFPRRSGGRKKDYDRILYESEGPGILNWLLDGFRMWWEDGLELPPEVVATTEDIFNEQDPIGQALKDVLEDTGHEEDRVQASQLVAACEQWFKRSGEEIKTGTAIGRRMKELGYRKKQIRGLIYYVGVRINIDYVPGIGD